MWMTSEKPRKPGRIREIQIEKELETGRRVLRCSEPYRKIVHWIERMRQDKN
jgi:hypothetical protein